MRVLINREAWAIYLIVALIGLSYQTSSVTVLARLYRILCPGTFCYVIGKRFSNMIANWLLTACYSRADPFHSEEIEFS